MKLTNCLIIMLTVIFVVGVSTSSYAGQKEVVVSPKADGTKVVPKKKVPRAPKAPATEAAEAAKPGKPKGKPMKLEKSVPKKNWPQVMCQGKVPTITGTSGDDSNMEGSLADDVIYGAGGNDTIKGYGGNDTLCGGSGGDALFGGLGIDRLDGGPGWDVCYGDDYDTFINCEKIIKQ